MPKNAEVTMIRTGDTPIYQTKKHERMGIHKAERFIFIERHVVITGAAIMATTAGLIPLKILMTIGLSLKVAKYMAIAKITRKLGRVVPKAEMIAPRIPLSLYPRKSDILTANTPGND